eukprot:TRINITY_DN6859_c0_g1_i1.p2 TRINITY_DN6859_c0_g1~~TRINITY_DN6859_c0_g1_i1.p2  ORF type:complete len:475 (+),score=95.68 TRINITY_DN6859_c0_g1_i1:2151-3575(+)
MSGYTQLRPLFPQISDDTLKLVFEQSGNDVNKAIDYLTNTKPTSPPPSPVIYSPPPPPPPYSYPTTSYVAPPPYVPPPPPRVSPTRKIVSLPNEYHTTQLLNSYGLNISTVSIDHTKSRSAQYGPCVSEITLFSDGQKMPVVKYPSYQDHTFRASVPIEKIPLVVGNETGSPLYTITLREYLENFRMYLTDASPSNWPGRKSSLLAPRDSYVSVNTQATLLPIPVRGELEYNVSVTNFHCNPGRPVVLCIVSTIHGTSAHIIDAREKRLYFNQKGTIANFLAGRSKEHNKNVVMVIQVPIRVASSFDQTLSKFTGLSLGATAPRGAFGKYSEVKGIEIERDFSHPVRVTLQYFKTTLNGVIDDNIAYLMAGQLNSHKYGDSSASYTPDFYAAYMPGWWDYYWSKQWYQRRVRGASFLFLFSFPRSVQLFNTKQRLAASNYCNLNPSTLLRLVLKEREQHKNVWLHTTPTPFPSD